MIYREEKWLAHDGIALHVVNWIPESKPRGVLGLVHGIGEHIGRYEHVAKRLSRAGYVLIACDLRGHGKSGGRQGDACYEDLLDDIETLLQKARTGFPGLPLFLYGHSMGGNLVLNYVLRRKPYLDGVIVTCPGLKPVSTGGGKLFIAQILRSVVPMMRVSNEVNPQYLSRDSTVVQAYLADPLVHDRVSLRLGLALLDAGIWAVQHAANFDYPLLFLQGGADKVVDVETNLDFAKAVPTGCHLKIWPALYHEIHNEPEKEKVFEEIVTWLNKYTEQADDEFPERSA